MMSETNTQNISEPDGQCLCGAVKFTLESPEDKVSACHCSSCVRWSSGPLLAVHCHGPVHFDGEENITAYRSSDWAERGFCNKCGTNLFYRLVEPGTYILSYGIFNGKKDFELENQIFIDEKPALYDFANKTPTMTGAEVFAAFAPKDE